jgi:hypothetical protein
VSTLHLFVELESAEEFVAKMSKQWQSHQHLFHHLLLLQLLVLQPQSLHHHFAEQQ